MWSCGLLTGHCAKIVIDPVIERLIPEHSTSNRAIMELTQNVLSLCCQMLHTEKLVRSAIHSAMSETYQRQERPNCRKVWQPYILKHSNGLRDYYCDSSVGWITNLTSDVAQ
jgi:hypothetical protein